MSAFIVPLDRDLIVGIGDRRAVWGYVNLALAVEYPDIPMIVAAPDTDEWCKADAVGNAVELADADVLIIHDADVMVAPAALRAAITACEHGIHWAVPHGPVHRYDEGSTRRFMADDHSQSPTLTRWAYAGVAGGGIVVVNRDVYSACPMDRRFLGWGGEDQAWGWALETLFGPPWRADVQLVHLWHPHAAGPGNHQKPPRIDNQRLRRAYRIARGDTERMTALVESGR